MNKNTWFVILLVVLIAGAAIFALMSQPKEQQTNQPEQNQQGKDVNPLNASYVIDGKTVALLDGREEKVAAPGSAEKQVTSVWGPVASGDLNGDGTADYALVLSQTSGGSGLFYYLAAALVDKKGPNLVRTNTLLLGDRIAVENVTIADNIITVNYADRQANEPMTAQPSVGITKQFSVEGTTLKEIRSLPEQSPVQKAEAGCTDTGKTWVAATNECEGVAKAWCDAYGGTFNECASACRNDPKAEICTEQCVQVCKIQ